MTLAVLGYFIMKCSNKCMGYFVMKYSNVQINVKFANSECVCSPCTLDFDSLGERIVKRSTKHLIFFNTRMFRVATITGQVNVRLVELVLEGLNLYNYITNVVQLILPTGP